MEPEPYQIRVVEEKRELDAKIRRLLEFVGHPSFWAIKEEARDLLIDQVSAMKRYSEILGKRIATFKENGI